jgi:hypothetical protein
MLTFDVIVSVLSVFVLIFFGIGIWKMTVEDMRELRERLNKKSGDKGHLGG